MLDGRDTTTVIAPNANFKFFVTADVAIRAQRRFKLDYWANSYAEDVHALTDILHNEYGNAFAKHKFPVAVCGPPNPAAYYFPSNFQYVKQRDKAEEADRHRAAAE